MNTFTAGPTDVMRHLNSSEISEVYKECLIAFQHGKQITIQIGFYDTSYHDEDGDYVEDVDYYLYGCYTKTDSEVSDYYNSGGMWSYNSPERFVLGLENYVNGN